MDSIGTLNPKIRTIYGGYAMNMQKYPTEWDTILALRKQLCDAFCSENDDEAFRLSTALDEIQLQHWLSCG